MTVDECIDTLEKLKAAGRVKGTDPVISTCPPGTSSPIEVAEVQVLGCGYWFNASGRVSEGKAAVLVQARWEEM